MSGVAGLRVRNLIRRVFDGKRNERLLERVKLCAWHRLSFAEDRPTKEWPDVQPVPDAEFDGLVVAARFADTRQLFLRKGLDGKDVYRQRPGCVTGGQTPYHFLVLTDGRVDQLVELGDIAMHAAKFNLETIGVAVAGDMTVRPMTPAQWQTCVTLAALLGAWGLEHYGHTSLAGASADPKKVCPGMHFGMPQLRTAALQNELAALTSEDAEAILVEAGVVF